MHVTDLEQPEQENLKLRTARKQFNAIVETTADGIAILDLKGYVLYCNSAAGLLFNRPAQDLVGNHLGIPLLVDDITEIEILRPDKSFGIAQVRLTETTWDEQQAYLVVLTDITESKRTADALRESEQKLRRQRDFAENLLDTSQAIILIIDMDGHIQYCNRYFEELSGYRLHEIKGQDWFTTFIRQEEHDRLFRVLGSTFDEGSTDTIVNSIQCRDGSLRLIEWHSRRLDGDDCIGSTVLATGIDCTMRLRAEEELRQSEEQFRLAFEYANDGMCLVGLDGSLLKVNDRMCEIFGYSADELEAMTVTDIACPGEKDVSLEFIKKALAGETSGDEFDKRYTHHDGRIIQGRVSSALVRDIQGAPQYFISQVQDCTERYEAARQLSQSERRMATLLGNLPGMAYRCQHDRQWTMKFVSGGCRALTGYEPSALIDNAELSFADLIHPDDGQVVWDAVEQAITAGKAFEIEYRINTAGGGVKWVWERGLPVILDDGTIQLEGFISDVTARKAAEGALTESKERYRQVFEKNPIGIYRTTPDGRVLMANPALVAMLGFRSLEELAARNLGDAEYFTNYPRAEFQAKLEQSGVVDGFESSWRRKDGKTIYVRENARAVRDAAGEIMFYEGTAEDITLRYEAEAALKESERELKEAHALARLGSWFWDVKTGDVEWSEEVFKIFQQDPSEFKPHISTILELSPWPEDHERDKDVIARAAESRKPGTYEQRFLRPDGSSGYYLSTYQGVYSEDGELIALKGTAQDITERKQAEIALAASEIQYRRLFESAKDGILIVDATTGKIINANPYLLELLEFQHEDIASKELWELEPFTSIADSAASVKELKEKGYVRYEDIPLKSSNNKRMEVEFISNAYQVNDSEVIQCNIRDITERKLADSALKESEKRFRTLVETMPDGMALLDKKLKIKFVNDSFCRMMAYERSQLLDQSLTEFLDAANQKIVREQAKKRRDGAQGGYELTWLTGEKKELITHVSAAPRYDSEGKFTGSFIVVSDITERKRAQQALADEAVWRRILIEQSRDGIVVLDNDGKVFEANQRFADMLRYSRQEMRELHVWDWEDQLPREQALQMVRSVDESGDHFETRHRRKDGSTYAVEISTNGAVCGGQKLIFCVCRDITERKRAEAGVLESESRYRALFETSADGILVADAETMRFTHANPKIAELLGYSPDMLIGMSVDDIHPPDDVAAIVEGFNAQVRGELTILPDIPCQRKDGSVFYADINSATAVINGQNSLIGFFRDVTERRKAAEALSESEARYRLLAENVTDVIWVADLDGKQTYVSPSVERILGYSVDEALTQHVWSTLEPESAELVQRMLIEELERDGEPGVAPHRSRVLEVTEKRKDGSLVRTETRASLIRGTDGKPVAVMGVNRDITTRWEAEAELRRSHLKLVAAHEALKQQQEQLIQSEKMASLGQLAAGVAHEINNPIAFIKSNLGTLRDYMKVLAALLNANRELMASSEEIKDDGLSRARERIKELEKQEDIPYMLRDIDDLVNESIGGTERVRDIVQDLRSFAHVGKDKAENADVNKIIESCVRITWNELKYKCEIEKDMQPLPALRCYPERLGQVFINLLVNAAQSIEDHGKIGISTHATDTHIVVRISDSGQGILPETMAKMFDPFFTTKEVGEGTGLGLAISHTNVKNHGGTIEVQSEPGVGSTFIIKLPLSGVPDE